MGSAPELRPAAGSDPELDPVLERLVFLETANDGLKTRLTAGRFDAGMRELGLREDLERARAEVLHHQEALDGFCRETLAAGRERDRAQAAAEESLKARDAAVQERDALRRDLESAREQLELARRGALDPDARRRIDALELELEQARRAAHEAESALLESRRRGEAEAAERLKALAAESAEREGALLKAAEDERRRRETADARIEALSAKLEAAAREPEEVRRGALEAEAALRESHRNSLERAQAAAEERLRALAREHAAREAPGLKRVEDSRKRVEALAAELERVRASAEDAARAQREAREAALAQADERFRTLAKTFAEREAVLLKSGETERRRLAEMTVELERAHAAARETEAAFVEFQRKTALAAQTFEAESSRRESQARIMNAARTAAEERLLALTARFAEREALLLKTAEDARRRLDEAGLDLELERARRGAPAPAESALLESERESRLKAEADAAHRLRTVAAQFAEREAQFLAAAENDRRRLDALGRELELARGEARRAEDALRESQKSSLLDAKTEAAERARTLASELAQREALLLKTAENDRTRVETLVRELERERLGAKETERALRESHLKSEQEAAKALEESAQRAARAAQALDASFQESARKARDEAAERLRSFAAKSAEREAELLRSIAEDRRRLEETTLKLEAERASARRELAAKAAMPADEAAVPAPFVSPPLEPALEPGWARLLRLVRPPVDSAYSHLRRLSATALTAGQKTLLRLAAASIAQASDSMSSIELALEDGPAPAAAAPALPVVEASLAAWEAAFRGRGVALARELPAKLPETAHDPKELRVALHHVLRNVLEAVPRGGRLTVRGSRGADGGLRLEFNDDGPGFPPQWLERRFEPFAAPRRGRAGLGLSLVRRTLRRWGGDAEASNGPSGRGARLALIFAPPPPPAPAPGDDDRKRDKK